MVNRYHVDEIKHDLSRESDFYSGVWDEYLSRHDGEENPSDPEYIELCERSDMAARNKADELTGRYTVEEIETALGELIDELAEDSDMSVVILARIYRPSGPSMN